MLHELDKTKRKVIITTLVLTISLLNMIIFNALGFEIPYLRQILGFIFLTFIPGLLIILILGLNTLSKSEIILYSVGLSIAFVMFSGYAINIIFPSIGILKPISLYPIILTMTISALILCGILVLNASELKSNSSIRIKESYKEVFPFLLLLPLIPLLSALGVFWLMLTKMDILIYAFLILVALSALLVAFNKIPEQLYPMTIFCISLGLMWHVSLVSPTLGAFDINHEYCLQKFVMDNSSWDTTHPWNVNAMLSIVILAPIYSIVLGLDTVWLFKIVYPFLFSFAPVALFLACRKQIDSKAAFFSIFLFMSWTSFFTDGGGHPRQAIAEMFLALCLLVFVSNNLTRKNVAFLLIIFGFSIVVSHYSTSYIYMLWLIVALLIKLLLTHRSLSKFQSNSMLTTRYVTLFIVFCIAWYAYISSGALLETVVKMGDQMYTSIYSDILTPQTRDVQVMRALGLAETRGGDLWWELARVFQWITQIFIIIGVMKIMFTKNDEGLSFEYKIFTFPAIGILGCCIILPYFASYFNLSRFYHLMLFILAPYCIIGGIYTLGHLNSRRINVLKLFVSLILIPYFLFTTGFIFDITGSTSTSMPLSLYEIDWPAFTLAEVHASKWIAMKSEENSLIYGDTYAAGMVYKEVFTRARRLPSNIKSIHEHPYYIFLRKWNLIHSEIISWVADGVQVYETHIDIGDVINPAGCLVYTNKIYNDGMGEIIWPQ